MPDRRRRNLVLGAAALAGVSFAAPAYAQSAAQAATQQPLRPEGPVTVTRVDTPRPQVALTFDDGPHHSLTPAVLDMLAARGARATFYVLGSRAARHPELLRRIMGEGHEIGNHTWSHPSLTGLSDANVLSQLDRTNRVIFDAVGRPPITLRPPYGNLSPRQAQMVFDRRGMTNVLWSVDPEDWRRPGTSVVAQRIINHSHTGAVILAHDIHAPTVRAVPAAIDGLIARGFELVTISELLGWPSWNQRNLRLAGTA